jgi:hypothetical protein
MLYFSLSLAADVSTSPAAPAVPPAPGASFDEVFSSEGINVVHRQPDIFTFVEVPDEKALSEMVLTTIQGISGVRATETHVVSAV